MGGKCSALVDELVGEVLDGVSEDDECAACLRADAAAAVEAGADSLHCCAGIGTEKPVVVVVAMFSILIFFFGTIGNRFR